MQIGTRIRELRQVKDISSAELAAQSGVQPATLSRIENLKMVGSLDSHMKIAQALGITIADLYSGITLEEPKTKNAPAEVHTNKTSAEVFIHSEKSAVEMLTTKILAKKMMPVLVRLEPGSHTAIEENSPGTEKFAYVLEGKMEVRVGNKAYPLSKGNSLYFDASLRHNFINNSKMPARALCVATPAAL